MRGLACEEEAEEEEEEGELKQRKEEEGGARQSNLFFPLCASRVAVNQRPHKRRRASVYMNILPAAQGIMPLICRSLLSEICEDTDFAISP